jgi:hypothetical protein
MTKFVRRRYWWSWLVLAILVFVPVHFLLEHPVATGTVLLILICLTTIAHFGHRSRLQHLIQSRPGESICDFARHFERHSVDTWIVRAVYEEIQDYLGAKLKVPIRAMDRLDKDLPIDKEDFEMDLAMQIAQRSGRSLDNTVENPYFGSVKTVEDVVLFFNAQPKVDPQA